MYQHTVNIKLNNSEIIVPAGFNQKQGQGTVPLTHPRRFPQEVSRF